MTLHPEELRLANSLRELILELGTTVEDVEGRLGWEAERLTTLLEGRKGWKLEEVFEVLSVLDLTPTDFYALHYGFKAKRTAQAVLDEVLLRGQEPSEDDFYDEVLDRRFKESQKVLQEAVRRRATWKQERAAD
jgi:hypothetical protein